MSDSSGGSGSEEGEVPQVDWESLESQLSARALESLREHLQVTPPHDQAKPSCVGMYTRRLLVVYNGNTALAPAEGVLAYRHLAASSSTIRSVFVLNVLYMQ